MNQTPTGPDAEVREALAAAVQSYGPAVLGNAQMLGNILTDLLPDHPRERSLLVAAAEAEAATLLQEQVGRQRLDAATAVALTARALMERRALDPTAARWATTAYATALGYNPPPAPAVGSAASPDETPTHQLPTQSTPPPTVPQPAAQQSFPQPSFSPQPGLPDAPTLIGPPGSSSLPPVGSSNPYAGGPQAFGPPGSGMPPVSPHPYSGMPMGPAGPGAPLTPRPPQRPTALIVAAVAVAVVLIGYLAVAGSAHLPPFTAGPAAHSVTPLPSPTPTPTPTPTPDPSPTGPVLDAGVTPLYSILSTALTDPATQCSPSTSYKFTAVGIVAAYYCTDTHLSGGGIWAYQMDTQADYQSTWVNFNKWWGFDASSAGGACPPSGSGHGLNGWHDNPAGYPSRTGQALECQTVGSGSSTQPAYTWALPTQNAFISAEGATGSSFASLNTWWENYSPPKVGSGPSPTSS
ncbi:hypothetical protein [Streptacidiphilus rugosus]|uniref:hypothetical protein n=1 Tax=Streptacidiphilus rugosus TaxID=405783 RepID=UPI000561D83A|nr:hypothetical protein [Streptacidiphilus rugosus]